MAIPQLKNWGFRSALPSLPLRPGLQFLIQLLQQVLIVKVIKAQSTLEE